ncbi:hypothetical protein OSB04_015847 [Centaurea solstitialis]|uniref:Knottins-like domain-containing protein n=1 Tax=Centaurea solstitialis TaxID=347529 RepID=A0AA38TI07_9ASTR|nr:hypothetical protein OSB04_015847 [Centaurea solstitialis]
MAAIAMWWWRWRWVVGGGGGNDAIGLVMTIASGDDEDDNMVVGEKTIDKTCERRSKTWTGYCGDSKHCDQQCREWEGLNMELVTVKGWGWRAFATSIAESYESVNERRRL